MFDDVSLSDVQTLVDQVTWALDDLRRAGYTSRAEKLQEAIQPLEDILSDASEEAAERAYEDFHGGSAPFTAEERHNAAWEEKRRLS